MRLSTDVFDLSADGIPGGISNLSKRCGRSTRYDPAPLARSWPDQSEGVICDEGTD